MIGLENDQSAMRCRAGDDAMLEGGTLLISDPQANKSPMTADASLTQPDLDVPFTSVDAYAVAGQTLHGLYLVTNVGSAEASASTSMYYLSADATVPGTDTFLGSHADPVLAPSQQDVVSVNVTLPLDLVPGTYRFGVTADADATVAESNENNNTVDDHTVVVLSATTSKDYSSVLVPFTIDLAAGTADSSWSTFGHQTFSGIDNVLTGLGNAVVYGNAHDNVLVGGAGHVTMFGGDGDDTLMSGSGGGALVGHADPFATEHNVLVGGAGDDALYAAAGDDVSGGAGYDALYVVNAHDFSLDLGASSIEYVVSDFGNDTFDAHSQGQGVEIYSSGGDDLVIGSYSADTIWAGSGNDTVMGGAGNDTIIGDVGADRLSGGGGNDTLYIDSSDTYVSGGDGYDAAYITGLVGDPGMVLDVAASSFEFVADFAGNNDVLNGANATAALTIYAGTGNDTVAGGSGADVIWGEAGNDKLSGGAGNDVLVGGVGADTLEGGPGVDTLYLNSGGGSDGARDVAVLTPGSGTDIVFDFTPSEDKLDLTAYHTSYASLTVVANGPHASVYLGQTFLASVANQAGHLTAGDFVF